MKNCICSYQKIVGSPSPIPWPVLWAPKIEQEGILKWTFGRVVVVTGMIEPKISRKIVKKLIIKWDPEVDLGCLVYES